MIAAQNIEREAILRVGEVTEVSGRTIYVTVDKDKNLSDVFLHGDVLKNISVNSFLEIRKGFLSIIGRVEGEKISEEPPSDQPLELYENRNKRVLTVALSGYIDEAGEFTGGTKELPLIGNSAYIITKAKLQVIHRLADEEPTDPLSILIADSSTDDINVNFPVDGLFNTHIAIFGNTGSGKSNTLAYLYQELFRVLQARNATAFRKNARFVLFDFNGEYANAECLSPDKKVYSLSTRAAKDRIPLTAESLLEIEVLSILADATEKTQKPFLSRAVTTYRQIMQSESPLLHLRNRVRKQVYAALQLPDSVRAVQCIECFKEIVPEDDDLDLQEDIEFNSKFVTFKMRGSNGAFFNSKPDEIKNTVLYKQAGKTALGEDLLDTFLKFVHLQLAYDILNSRAQHEHITPVINRLKGKRELIDKLFDVKGTTSFWQSNVVVVNMHDVNLDMRKTIPLLLARQLYTEHKRDGKGDHSLTVIVDEAHNILSNESFRETEDWKNYRLETFEEIIKEGRKFGVFVTLASQRPNDISPTITSQAHNYFIHRLINDKDLLTIASAVSYIDRVTRESIPTLPTGTCIFSGIAGQMPIKVAIRPLSDDQKPKSATRTYREDVVPRPSSGIAKKKSQKKTKAA